MNEELKEIGNLLLENFKSSFSGNVYMLWIQSLRLFSLTENEAVFSIDNDFKRDIVEKKYKEKISEIVCETLGFPVTVTLISDTKKKEEEEEYVLPHATVPERVEKHEDIIFKEKASTPLIPKMIEGNEIVEEYTFENFIVGDSNRFAHAAAEAVAKNPFDVHNPLFIYGSSGLGKTHLLYAITNEIKKNNPYVRILFTTCEEFTNQMVESISKKSTPAFREVFRSIDVLLIDDVQFIAGKDGSQEEFFNTFNALYEHKKQIILTSDRPPKDIPRLEERLRTRFEWGLIADIQKPNLELRTAIIQKKAQVYGVDLSPDIINFLAANIHSNVRQIEGSIKRIAAISRITNSPITLDMCKRGIADILETTVSTSDMIENIISLVSKRYNVSSEDIKGKKRDSSIVNARHICIYLIRQMNELSLKQIASYFSKDHATIFSSIRKVENDMERSEEKKKEIEYLMKDLHM